MKEPTPSKLLAAPNLYTERQEAKAAYVNAKAEHERLSKLAAKCPERFGAECELAHEERGRLLEFYLQLGGSL